MNEASTTRVLRIVTRLNTGGPARHLATITRALDGARFQQWLAAGREGPGEGSMRQFVEDRGIEIFSVPEMVATPRLEPRDVLAFNRLRHLIRRLRPDIVETHLSKAGILGRLAARMENVPAVVHVFHGLVFEGHYGPVKSWTARLGERALAHVTDRFVAVSDSVKDNLVRMRVAPADRINVVELGVDIEGLSGCRGVRGELRRELGLDARVRLVGFVGRLTAVKNPRLFIDAAAAVAAVRSDLHFLVVGDGDLGPAMRAHARNRGLSDRLTFTGWRHDLPGVYADLDLLVLSSQSEGTPMAIIEALVASCPVVATRVGGVSDLIEDGVTGVLVPPAQREPLAAAIIKMIDDPVFARALAAAARSNALARFDKARLARTMSAFYEDVLESARHQPTARSASQRATLHGWRAQRTPTSERSRGTL